MILAEFGVGQVLWSALWLALFALWFFLVVMVFSDIVVSSSLSGWAKALWALGIIVLPYVGVFLYLIVNGDRDKSRRGDAQSAAEHAAAALHGTPEPPPTAQFAPSADLHNTGAFTDNEDVATPAVASDS